MKWPDCINPERITPEMVALAKEAMGDRPHLHSASAHTVLRPGDPVAQLILADALEDAGMTCTSAFVMLRLGCIAVEHNPATNNLRDLADFYKCREARSALNNDWHGTIAKRRHEDERHELLAAMPGQIVSRKVVRRECKTLEHIHGFSYDSNSEVSRIFKAVGEQPNIYHITKGPYHREPRLYFTINSDNEGVCIGKMRELLDRLCVQYRTVKDLERLVDVCCRNGVCEVTDGQMRWYCLAVNWDKGIEELSHWVWIGDEWNEAYNDLCAFVPHDDDLRRRFARKS